MSAPTIDICCVVWPGGMACGRPSKAVHEGQHYCGIHNPARIINRAPRRKKAAVPKQDTAPTIPEGQEAMDEELPELDELVLEVEDKRMDADGWVAVAIIGSEYTSVAFKDEQTARAMCVKGEPFAFKKLTRVDAELHKLTPLPSRASGSFSSGLTPDYCTADQMQAMSVQNAAPSQTALLLQDVDGLPVVAYCKTVHCGWPEFNKVNEFSDGSMDGEELVKLADVRAMLAQPAAAPVSQPAAPAIPLPAAPVQGWQPIEAAPKERIFGYGENNYGPYLLLTDGHEVVRGRWWFHNDGAENFIRDGGIAFHASHYMHLPPPPVGENE